MPVPLDEFPIHQTPLSMRYVGTSDRNFYDRCYFNAHDRTGETFLITGLGYYPQLGVKDAYVCVKRGSVQHVVRMSDAIDDDRMAMTVGPYRIEALEPLHRIRLVCDVDDHGIAMDLTWEGSFPAVDEEHHVMRQGIRPIIDASRFAQLGSWSGVLRVAGEDIAVDPDTWVGSRDRSWGIRPVGDPEPASWPSDEEFGFWWLYVPLRFDDFAVVLIAQEDANGYRTLNDAVRVFADGRREQLGWPHVQIHYRSGTRIPTGARIELTTPSGSPLTVNVEALGFVPLHVGCGYGGDSEWQHGQARGHGWIEAARYDLTDPAVEARIPWGVIDHVARATVHGAQGTTLTGARSTTDSAVGWGLFEHGTIGKHAPSGFADLGAVAP